MLLIALASTLAGTADAAEVIWLSPPPDEATARLVGEQAGATRGPLAPIDLRAAGTDWGKPDDAAYATLAQTLSDVRQYETKLDGELLIMDELSGPIAGIGIVRNETDRKALFSALAYQGFAIDRYFADTLASDDRAAPYRTEMDGLVVAMPWADAIALDTERQVTPYDIAEAPQRVMYAKVMDQVKRSLPARVVPKDLPVGGHLFADGKEVTAAAAGSIALVPGRHLLHFEKDGHVLARWDVRLASAAKLDLSLPVDDATWDGFVAGLKTDTAPPIPYGVAPSIAALGGEVWTVDVTTDAKGKRVVRAWKLTPTGAEPVTVALAAPMGAVPGEEGKWSALAAVEGGWLASGDFYNDDPLDVPNTKAAVNAGTVVLDVGFDRDFGILRAGVGLTTTATLGEYHVAHYGDSATRIRPYPYLAFGVRWAQLTVGYLFPHNPGFGLRGTVPLAGPLELVAGGTLGLGTTVTRDDLSLWEGLPVYSAQVGLGFRPEF
jgi:hypothetical protein